MRQLWSALSGTAMREFSDDRAYPNHDPGNHLDECCIVNVARCHGQSKPTGRMVYWAAALILQTASYVFIHRSGQIGEFPAFLVSTVLRSCAWAAFAEGLYEFYRLPPPRSLIWMPVAMVFLAFVALFDHLTPRTIVISLISASQCLLALSVMWPKRCITPGRGKHFLATGLAIAMTLLLLRAIAAARGGSAVLVSMESSQIQTMSLLGVLSALMLLSFGFVIMSKDRADD